MLDLPKLEQLTHITALDDFVTEVLIPICVQPRWHVDYQADRCGVIGHYNQDQPNDWQRFIDEFITPFCQERGWSVEILPEDDAAIVIYVLAEVEAAEAGEVRQLTFFDLWSADPDTTSNYLYEG